jgi:uncharacterized protein (DUF58 family)
MKALFLTKRFFGTLTALVVCFLIAFFLPSVYPFAIALFLIWWVVIGLDAWGLFQPSCKLDAKRKLPMVFSLGDVNTVTISIQNFSTYDFSCTVIDELPHQLQIRDFEKHAKVQAGKTCEIRYEIKPLTRGAYSFGQIHLFASGRIGLLQRRFRIAAEAEIPVFPSILQMKKYELRAFNRMAQFEGLKRMRRIGHSYEFDQIKNYVRGDDYRSINWKASSRRSHLMVNQYEDERSQQIYCIIDKSRAMRMPFEGLSLMDYAINTSLVISNIALQKHDRAGLITFSDKIGAAIKSDSKPNHLQKLLQALYREQERPVEANFELLFQATSTLIQGRSLILLFSNFESTHALDRVLPILRRINTRHLLVVIFFENTEIENLAARPVTTVEEIYQQTTAQQFLAEKRLLAQKIQQHGIQAVLTRPEDLSIDTINKYLEMKARGLI